MAYVGSPLEFHLNRRGHPYGRSGTSSAWTLGTNVQIYEYGVTITGGVPSGTLALDNAGATPTLQNDSSGNAYLEDMPAGNYTLLLNYLGGNNWIHFPGKRCIHHGRPATIYECLDGDGGSEYDLTALAPDGATDRNPIWNGNPSRPKLRLLFNGRTKLFYGQDFTLSDMTITLISLPYMSPTANLAVGDYLDCEYDILPGGGY